MSDDLIIDDTNLDLLEEELDEDELSLDAAGLPRPYPILPRKLSASGLYKASNRRIKLPVKSQFAEDSRDEFESEIGFIPGKKDKKK